jgi:hypothetical protein
MRCQNDCGFQFAEETALAQQSFYNQIFGTGVDSTENIVKNDGAKARIDSSGEGLSKSADAEYSRAIATHQSLLLASTQSHASTSNDRVVAKGEKPDILVQCASMYYCVIPSLIFS